MQRQILDVLDRDGLQSRCIVTLPTGAGKTRVAVESFIDWMQNQENFTQGKYLIWIAQSEELCEQAIACIKQMWGAKGFGNNSLRIYRYFGGRNINENDLVGGAVVASIHQLHNRIKSKDLALRIILKNTGAMIIDEAHYAVSDMYSNLLDTAEEICGKDLFPICGLTATPGRSDERTMKLVDRFEAHLIAPNLDSKYAEYPIKYFREHEYLARAKHIFCRYGNEYELTDNEADQLERERSLPKEFLKKLAADNKRNLRIMKKLLSLPEKVSILLYACTVDHARLLATLLMQKSRPAGIISSDTPASLRRALIHQFKEQKIRFLCNYGVLTTGFDAPKVDHIVLCRPTTSEVLYEQIVGRGLRGPKFGGNKECTIIDFEANLLRHGSPISYAQFKEEWKKMASGMMKQRNWKSKEEGEAERRSRWETG